MIYIINIFIVSYTMIYDTGKWADVSYYNPLYKLLRETFNLDLQTTSMPQGKITPWTAFRFQ